MHKFVQAQYFLNIAKIVFWSFWSESGWDPGLARRPSIPHTWKQCQLAETEVYILQTAEESLRGATIILQKKY